MNMVTRTLVAFIAIVLITASCSSENVARLTQNSAITLTKPVIEATQPLVPTRTIEPDTPTAQSNPQHLRVWTEGDALAALAAGEKAADSEKYFPKQAVQYAVTLAREALLRFPDSPQAELTRWTLAYRQATTPAFDNSAYSIQPFATILEHDLNAGQVTTDRIGQWLEQHHTVLAGQYSAPNLFGDNQAATVLHIEVPLRIGCTNDAVMVLSGSQAVGYRIFPVRDKWMTYYCMSGGGEEIIRIADRTGNGQPEVESIINGRGHAGCYSELGLYEWHGVYPDGQFTNAANNVPPIFGEYTYIKCEKDQVWGFGPRDKTGAQPMIVSMTISGPKLEQVIATYVSANNSYQWPLPERVEGTVVPSATALQHQKIIAIEQTLFESKDVADAAKQLDDLFATPPLDMPYQGMDSVLPHLLYLRGLVYELSGQPENALVYYEQILKKHTSSPYAIIAKQKLSQ